MMKPELQKVCLIQYNSHHTLGYGELLKHLQEGVAVQLNSRVESIGWTKDVGVKIVYTNTQSNTVQTIASKSCLVTVSVGVLQRGAIRFIPQLEDKKLHAISAFRMEPATKLIYRFDEKLWDDNLTYMAHTG
jgi:monoamine oxidase